jgi:hypothetical protein
MVAGATLLFALSACQGPETAPSSPAEAPAQPENGKVLFSEKFSDAGLIQIVSDASGNLNTAVQARIGSEAEKLLSAGSAQPTLADVYKTLHGGSSEVPALVTQASEQIEQGKLANPANLADDVRLARPPLAKAASESDFVNGYCHDYTEGSYKWRLWGYDWWYSLNMLEAGLVTTGDRITAWNVTPWTLTMSLLGEHDYDPSPNTWKPTVPPYWVTWFTWGGTYHYARARETLPVGKKGELGIALHYAVPVVVK